jgi:hypothetical protein
MKSWLLWGRRVCLIVITIIYKHYRDLKEKTTKIYSKQQNVAYIITCKGPSWSWSYGSSPSNYLRNQCLSPLMLWVRILLRWGVLDTTLCDKVCQWLATGWWFSPDTPVSSTNKTDRHVILLKVALNTINHKPCKIQQDKKQKKQNKNHCVKISKGAVKLLRKKHWSAIFMTKQT